MSVLTVRDVAQIMKKSEETIKRYIRAGKFPNAFKISDKEGWRIPPSDLHGQASSAPQPEQLIIDTSISTSDQTSQDEIQELVSLAYQAVTLTYPTEELIDILSGAGIHRTLQILLVMQQSPKKVRNPIGFVKTALKEGWTPNTIPQKVDRRRMNFEERHGLESTPSPNGFPLYNWLEEEV